ncbi:PH domain-containing protein [Flavobacterium sp. GB2R13]|uniref:PH domain-containing protein n=1 Tax=Flavobacterium algoris TaxID=3398733 RepID=UPI003A8978D6
MANCIACNKRLGMLNTPMFSKGQTKDSGTICTSCHMSLAMNNASHISNKMKQFTNQEVIETLQQINSTKEQIKSDKKEEFERKVEQHKNQISSNNERLQKIKLTISKLNPTVVNKIEVSELPTILMEDENIEKINSGFLDEGKGSTGNGLLVGTNYRVIFIDKPMFGFGIKMEDFPYDKISSVSVETGFLKGVLKIICSGNTAKINLVTGAKEFSEFVRQKTMLKPIVHQQVNIESDILGQIEKLAELKEKGILTEEEFNEKKVILLAKL